MKFQLESTDGPAQKGTLHHKSIVIPVPNIIFNRYNNLPIPGQAGLLNSETTDTYQQIYHVPINQKGKNQKKAILFKTDKPFYYPRILSKNIHTALEETHSFHESNCSVLTEPILDTTTPSLADQEISLYIIGHGLQLFNNPHSIVPYLQKLRRIISPDQLIYMPAVAQPNNMALLTYLGVDFFDTSQAILAARKKILFLYEGNISISTIDTIPCSCPSCLPHQQTPSTMSFIDILTHNYQMMVQEINTIHRAISKETLRELLCIRTSNSPHLTSILRLIEKDLYHLLEQKTPIHRDTVIQATHIDAIYRPEIKRFQHRILSQYQKPAHPSILLLLPCSAKKPYSTSKSHKRYRHAIQSIRNHYSIHELIITSPLGIVPRELELMYPASSYDIPVIGEWFEDEKTMIITLLQQYLLQNRYDHVIIHLPEPLQSLIKKHVPEAILTQITSSPTSKESLQSLTSILRKYTENVSHLSGKQRYHDTMVSLCTFQFSEPMAAALLNHTTIKGTYPYLKIMDSENQQLGMLTQKRGMISLTLKGGKRMQSMNHYTVTISDDFTVKGSIFAPGVINADPQIRKGDEVLVFQQQQLKAVGVAKMNGIDMVQRMSGKAVDTRHIAD